jgi:ADP-heptose:LPS heptosyltransferase
LGNEISSGGLIKINSLATPTHVLVLRFSALGDVAMTIPVITQVLQQYPDLRITFVSNKSFQPLFKGIDRLQFHPADLRKEHRGVKGLYRLYNQLKKEYDFDAIADLHQVLRSKALRTFFSFSSRPVAILDKGRKQKKLLTRKENKILAQLPTMYERYAEVFKKLGLQVKLDKKFIPVKIDGESSLATLRQDGYRLIGIAPFAKHREKMYPLEKMKEVVSALSRDQKTKTFLFGGGKKETEFLEEWEKEFPGTEVVAGKMKLDKELEYISQLDVMVSMDSANMHLASLVGVPVVSIWGATHPFLGFYGWGQDPGNAVHVDLFCRPCSVFGKKPCYRHNWECMESILPATIVHKIKQTIGVTD